MIESVCMGLKSGLKINPHRIILLWGIGLFFISELYTHLCICVYYFIYICLIVLVYLYLFDFCIVLPIYSLLLFFLYLVF